MVEDTRNPTERELGRLAGTYQQLERSIIDLSARLEVHGRSSEAAHMRNDARINELTANLAQIQYSRRISDNWLRALLSASCLLVIATVGWGFYIDREVSGLLTDTKQLNESHTREVQIKREDDEHLRSKLDVFSTTIATISSQIATLQSEVSKHR